MKGGGGTKSNFNYVLETLSREGCILNEFFYYRACLHETRSELHRQVTEQKDLKR